MGGSDSLVIGELGPTNTGKTHRAIGRMLEHSSGMMGLPLRLLAREVYDRVTARVGEGRVALVTGEEKRVPPHADYWICTVEAMPTDRLVDFLAVDEIQLAAHRERGHIFTERLLYARGRRETWFLGSDTMRPMLRTLIPHASLRRSDRLSQLRWTGRKSLKSLPPRSAAIAFSSERVYELAESLRRLRGGVAVVLGALSPRTRNAQVAMYQAGEVQYLVATDAVGMGLNLDLDHVAFASLSKFDGFEQRGLTPDELAQVAGRAGRHLNHGTFGTLSPLPELPPRVVSAIETHRFAPVERLVWRNEALDFSSIEALQSSLAAPPSHAVFARVERADDFDALKLLVRLPEVRERASQGAALELLWQVCQIPDFRKRLFDQHVTVLREVFLQLVEGDGRIAEDWFRRQAAPLDDTTGDIYRLMDRLAAIRVCTYISQKTSWMHQPEHWQAETRRIEDALGDALHERLVERFVERAARRTPRRFQKGGVTTATNASPFAQLQNLAEETLTETQFIQQLVEAPHEAFDVDAQGRIAFEGEPIARLTHGNDWKSPQLALAESDAWSAGGRHRLQRRLVALAHDLVTEAKGGFPADALQAQGNSAPTRGLAYRLSEGMGIVRRHEAMEQWTLLNELERQRFTSLGLRLGHRFAYVAGALSPRGLERRCMLLGVFEQRPVPREAPREPTLDTRALGGFDAEQLGYEEHGRFAVRIDWVERLSEALRLPHGGQGLAQTLLRELPLDGGARAQLLSALGARRRRRRRQRRPAPAR